MADLIDRQQLLQHLDNCLKTGGYNAYIVAMQCYVEQMPTVEPRRGEWEGYVHSAFYGMDDFDEPIYRDRIVWYCSNPKCRRKTVIKENFCPSCGADMRGEEDD